MATRVSRVGSAGMRLPPRRISSLVLNAPDSIHRNGYRLMSAYATRAVRATVRTMLDPIIESS